MENVYDILKERGYIEQSTNDEEVRELLGGKPITFYIGFDPTADSLHVGHFIQVMVMTHMQRAGHRPLALVGGATGMIGDPSGRTDMRQMLTMEQIQHNVDMFKIQLSRFINFNNDAAFIVNNADWLLELKYLDFIREYGKFFSVNRMLTAECFKSRLEKGLSFLEFNYMLMQSYDFLELFRKYNCILELGGSDQWSNILAGADLVRRVEAKPAYGLTFRLLTTSNGKKMGKTENGAVWLDPQKTSPYEFYQYWRNIEDADVENCLALLTFLPIDEVHRLGALQDAEINTAKEILAFEVTQLVHGTEQANAAQNAARAVFSGQGETDNVPSSQISVAQLAEMDILSLLTYTGLITSNSEGRRLIKDGGIYLNDQRISTIDTTLTEKDFTGGKALLRKGKKIYHQVNLK